MKKKMTDVQVAIVGVVAAFAMAIAGFAVADSADAHYIDANQAKSIGSADARNDCGRAWDWRCANFPLSVAALSAGSHSYWIFTTYREQKYTGSTRMCETRTRVEHTTVAESSKSC